MGEGQRPEVERLDVLFVQHRTNGWIVPLTILQGGGGGGNFHRMFHISEKWEGLQTGSRPMPPTELLKELDLYKGLRLSWTWRVQGEKGSSRSRQTSFYGPSPLIVPVGRCPVGSRRTVVFVGPTVG